MNKAQYVQEQVNNNSDRNHTCHAEGCTRKVPPAYLMCHRHWLMVPIAQQKKVWEHFRPGQEQDKRPSAEYLQAMKEAIRSVRIAEAIKNGGQLNLLP